MAAGSETVWSWNTQLPADCVAFCPYPGLEHILVCGTYLLHETASHQQPPLSAENGQETTSSSSVEDRPVRKSGSVCVLDVKKKQLIQWLDPNAAVLDIQWRPLPDSDRGCDDWVKQGSGLVAVALSSGRIALYQLQHSLTVDQELSPINPTLSYLQHTKHLLPADGDRSEVSGQLDGEADGTSQTVLKLAARSDQLCPGTAMALSVCWSSNRSDHLLATDSAGNICLLQVSERSGDGSSARVSLHTVWFLQCNDHEAWCCALGCDVGDAWPVYTGGDDCTLRMYESRCGMTPVLVSSSRRGHDSGVTSLMTSPAHADHVYSGGYDGFVADWDQRQMKRPVDRLDTGGGVWRLKSLPRSPPDRERTECGQLLLTASMHVGACLLPSSLHSVIYTFTGHDSMVYGADWCRDPDSVCVDGDNGSSHVFATCSFYDGLLCLWRPPRQQ